MRLAVILVLALLGLVGVQTKEEDRTLPVQKTATMLSQVTHDAPEVTETPPGKRLISEDSVADDADVPAAKVLRSGWAEEDNVSHQRAEDALRKARHSLEKALERVMEDVEKRAFEEVLGHAASPGPTTDTNEVPTGEGKPSSVSEKTSTVASTDATALTGQGQSSTTPAPGETSAEGVVETAVAAAAAVHADRTMQGVGDCPAGQATPLRLPLLPNTLLSSDCPQCARDSRLLDLHLRNHTLWAVQMQDAGAAGMTGVLEGNVYHLGDFDECLSSEGPVAPQYCLAEINIHTPPRTPDHRNHPDREPDPLQSVWNRIKHDGEEWRLPLDSLHVAVCAPASCSPQELQQAAQRALDEHATCSRLPIAFSVRFPDTLCTSREKQRPRLTKGEIAYLIVITFLVCAVASGSLIDYYAKKKKGCLCWFLLLFSVKRTWNMLTKDDPRPSGLNLDALSGARTVNMVLLVIAHRGFNTLRGPVHNYNDWEAMPRRLMQTGATHAQLFVDTCFAMSGLLVALLELTRAHAMAFKDCDSHSRPSILSALVHRYIRLTPTYAIVVFFYATIFWRMGSGPLWDQVIGHEGDACARYWWANLLYVNNYVNTEKLCMFQSWYLPCDIHLFVVGTALTLLVVRHRRVGLAFVWIFFVVAMIIPFVVTFLGSKPALLHMHPSLFRAPDKSENFRTMYAPTHIRAAPYLVGLLAGYVFHVHGIRGRDPYSKGVTWLVFGGGLALSLAALLSSVIFYDPDMEYDGLAAGIYAALCPVVWATGSCLILGSVVLGSKTPMCAMLSWRPMVILSRLTYNVYLTHWAFQVASVAKVRSPYHLDIYNMISLSMGDLVTSFGTATVLFLAVEAPFRSLARKLSAPPPQSKVARRPAMDEKPSALEAGFGGAIPRRGT